MFINSKDNLLLYMKNINKSFHGFKALKNVDLELRKGEVHAILGENGAGKSTLIKVLGGIYKADKGEIYIKGEKVEINNVNSSKRLGISIIHQELCLLPNMTVSENIFLGREPVKGIMNFVDFSKIQEETSKILKDLGINNIKPNDLVSHLSIAQQQMVEIAKALSINAEIIVMDEPTSSITNAEVEKLFEFIKRLKQKGVSFIYISHRLEELYKISDRISVLRDGEYIGTERTKSVDNSKLIKMMVGRNLKDIYNAKDFNRCNESILKIENINRKNILSNINFNLYKGEILGIFGLMGAGRTELSRAIFGIDKIDSGKVYISDKEVKINSPMDAIKNGLALVPENRKEQGLILINTVGYNITISTLHKFINFIKVDKQVENLITDKYIKSLSIKTPSADSICVSLSGGNQQKVVIGKWLSTEPKVLILDEPTRGIDVLAKSEIYSLIQELALKGIGIIFISSELSEIINLSTRVMVMHEGKVSNIIENKDEITQENIMHYATGGKKYGNTN